MNLPTIPAFGETDYVDEQQTKLSRVILLKNTPAQRFEAYGSLLEVNGFVKKEETSDEVHRYAAYQGGDTGVFINYFTRTGELQMVTEQQSPYFTYEDTALAATVEPQITQLHLEDFGLSYAVRLSDGRFVVFDGGFPFPPDADRLYECLQQGSPFERPIIAAWIMTHPHRDHFYIIFPFMEAYGERVTVEKFLFHFPDADDLTHYPALSAKDPTVMDEPDNVCVARFLEIIRSMGAPIYVPHTGQTYRVGDATFTVLACMDDTIHCTKNLNSTSLIFRMELGGQTVLWTADASFSDARLPGRYGATLKADILQVPHHGFGSGTAEAQIAAYDFIRPRVCLLPVNEYNAYTAFVAFVKGSRYLMTCMGVEELITGETTRTITLPYTPHPAGARELAHSYLAGQDNAGARTWVFAGLHTSCPEDLRFHILNTTHLPATVQIELYFEDASRRVEGIRVTVHGNSYKPLCITDPAQVDSEWMYFNRLSLEKQGVPEDAPFAVRFLSDIPVVVSHTEHAATYRSTVN